MKFVPTSGRSRRALAAAALSTLLVTAACGRGGDTAGDGDLSGPGFDGHEFSIAALTVTSGPGAVLAAPGIAGLEAYFAQLNADGGVDGKYPVRVQIRDTAMDPARAVQHYNSLRNDVALIGQSFATPPTKAVLPLVEKDNMLMVTAGQSGDLFRESQVVMPTTPYETQYLTAIDYAMQQWPGTKVCGAAGEGETTQIMQRVLAYASEKMGVTTGPVVALPAGAGDYAPQIQQLERAGCEVVPYLALAIPVMSSAFSSAAQLSYEPHWLGSNSGFMQAMKDSPVMGYAEKNVRLICDCTDYGDTERSTAMADLMAAHDEFASNTAADWNFRNGYAAGMVIDEILGRAVESGDISREGLAAASTSMDDLNFGGIQFPLTWGTPDDRRPATQYSVFVPDRSTDLGLRMELYGGQAPEIAVSYPFSTGD